MSQPLISSASTPGGTADSAKEHAADVAGTAQQRAGEVAGTAKEHASKVASEAAGQVHQLAGQAGDQLETQVTQQSRQVAGQLRSVSEELHTMAAAGSSGTPAQSLVAEVGHRTATAADYLERVSPRQMVADLQDFGRRRPAAFIAGAAVAGLLVGRLTKSVKNATDTGGSPAAQPSTDLTVRQYGDMAPDLESSTHGAPTIQSPVELQR